MRNSGFARGAMMLGALVLTLTGPLAGAQERRAVPREGGEQSGTQPRERRPPDEKAQPPQRKPPDDGQRRATPRPAPAPRTQGRSEPRDRRSAQPRVEAPRPYHFPPVRARLNFYYHPYFGFYYGPYYGPHYWSPRPYHPIRYGASAVRLHVNPVETEVYVNGYYAGIVDDFDGVLQRLYLPPGEHDLTLRLDGYATYAIPVRVPVGGTLDVTHRMRPLPAGAPAPPPPAPRALPREWTEPPADVDGEDVSSPYGMLSLRTDPADAKIYVDGDAWAAVNGQSEFVIHLPAGWHEVEVRREGYMPFSMRVELTEGHTTRLDARLMRR